MWFGPPRLTPHLKNQGLGLRFAPPKPMIFLRRDAVAATPQGERKTRHQRKTDNIMAVFTEEQTMLRDAAKAWVAERSPVAVFRKLRDGGNADGFDRAVWREMAQMGWTGILVPEEYGGTDLGCLTLGIVLEETGRTLTASPLLSTALIAASAPVPAGTEEQKQEWLPQIADGSVVGCFAVDEGAHHHPDKLAMTKA